MMKRRTRPCLAVLAFVLASAAPGAAQARAAAQAANPAATAFEALKVLEGEWRGRSTKGWQDRVSIRTIARGSAVIFTSDFDAHPGETMVTVITLDRARLLLTHYCVAGNQPRMAAAGLGEEDRSLLFTFIDGGNLGSRDEGHMDKALYHLIDEDHFTSRWTWFQEGAEQWMEEIAFERVR